MGKITVYFGFEVYISFSDQSSRANFRTQRWVMFSWLWRNSPDYPWGRASWWAYQASIRRDKPAKLNTSYFIQLWVIYIVKPSIYQAPPSHAEYITHFLHPTQHKLRSDFVIIVIMHCPDRPACDVAENNSN